MDTSLLQQPLTANTALEWLRNSLDASESIQPESSQEWVAPEEALEAILGCEWESEQEFLMFFREISIELARTATEDPEKETAELFGNLVASGLSFWSPYLQLWERAYQTKSPRIKEKIEINDWETSLDASIESLDLINLIPLAFAYEQPLREELRESSITELTPEQEEFLGYFAAMIAKGYYEGDFPAGVINIPSSRILAEILEDWTAFDELWTPDNIHALLLSEHSDNQVKAKIARVLKGEDDYAPEAWEEHREEEWSEEEIEEILALCE